MKMDKKRNTYTLPDKGEKQRPFLVPEHYFEQLPERVMRNIRNSQADSHNDNDLVTLPDNSGKWRLSSLLNSNLRTALSAAAVVAVLFLAGWMVQDRFPNLSLQQETNILSASIQEPEYNDDLLDYAMLDHRDIEYYLTVAE